MKLIPLTQGKFAKVDDEDFDYLSQFNWFAHQIKKSDKYYARRNKSIGKGRVTPIYMHREIMNAKKGEFIDHENRDGLNCQKYNLRKATPGQNAANVTSRKNSSSIFLGVYGKRNKWLARITKDGICYNLGTYNTEPEAAKAYNAGAKYLHGNFANLNIIC